MVVSIDPNIVIGLSTAVGAGIGGAISLLASRRQAFVDSVGRRAEKLARDYVDACAEIAAFSRLEEAYSKRLAGLTQQNEQHVKLAMRDTVEHAGGGRPTWSAREATRRMLRLRGFAPRTE